MEKETEQNAPEQNPPEPHEGFVQSLVLESENSKRFLSLVDEILADLKPQTRIERILVSDFTASYWRQLRIRQMEKALMDYEIGQGQFAPAAIARSTRAVLACRFASDQSRIFDLLGRTENRHARNMAATLRLLLQFRAARPDPYGDLPRPSHQNRKENF